MTLDEIAKAAKDLEKRDREERHAALRAISDKFRLEKLALWQACEDNGGHFFVPMPENGINHPHWKTGKWRATCRCCKISGYMP